MLKNSDSRHRLIISVAIGVLVCVLLPSWLRLPTRTLCAWNLGADCFLGLTWWIMFRTTPQKMRRFAQLEYQGRVAILTLIIASACASVLAIGFLLTGNTKSLSTILLTLHVTLAVMTIISSWLLVHTIFAMQYARTYYQVSNSNTEQIAGGLDFPNDEEPDYWDFLYFSFVIGMTSQVSDVQTISRSMRRLTLLHGILSFFFNTSILAMSINIIAALI
ncbi:DUF1345 domain-containing protein [Brasilonema octagenarum UFV-E1]|uniref:DUF1345 domain-containing protein n=2 Tax=Brasilonema TaxID=383614 RepID=A0A856M5U0_9CYAN|nr:MULTISPECIES: DUF1345 domain-containing protein [Brasilonema]NMF62129.1 DUF1345 domain-containing protein [Brasilonema octagenarum UFV-OR1]QDL06553.1 DUF1345 domain-containing protein [Brasilonema sennae CENA114]QDL12924.1 DUF1345 domain-containing protein [Brasilonema octagenarum UFV-E1]